METAQRMVDEALMIQARIDEVIEYEGTSNPRSFFIKKNYVIVAYFKIGLFL